MKLYNKRFKSFESYRKLNIQLQYRVYAYFYNFFFLMLIC